MVLYARIMTGTSQDLPRTTQELLSALLPPWPRQDLILSNGTFSVRKAPPLDPATAEPAPQAP